MWQYRQKTFVDSFQNIVFKEKSIHSLLNSEKSPNLIKCEEKSSFSFAARSMQRVKEALFFLSLLQTRFGKHQFSKQRRRRRELKVICWSRSNASASQYTRFFQNLSLYNVNGGISRMKPCLVSLERALLLTVFGQVVVAPFEF